MIRRRSGPVLVLMRLLSLCNEHTSANGFTKQEIARWAPIQEKAISDKTLDTHLKRFIRSGIVESPGFNARNKRIYRIKNNQWANLYIEGGKERPWLTPNPNPPSDSFLEKDEHRPHFNVVLTPEVAGRILGYCDLNHGQRTLRAKAFVLSFNEKSLRGQIFVRPYWRTEVRRKIGEDFYEYLVKEEATGNLQGDFCLPIDVKGERFYIGGRPTQFSASHYTAQLDVRAKANDAHLRDGLYALTNQADFNVRTLDFQDAVLETLQKQGEAQTKLRMMLEKVVKVLNPEPEREYAPAPQEDGHYMYG